MDGDGLQRKLQSAVNTMLEDIEESRMRSLQKNAFLGMAKCFDVRDATHEQRQRCVSMQEQLLQGVNAVIQSEMNDFRNRLQRCSMGCQDEVRDRFGEMSQGDTGNIKKAEAAMMKCASGCIDRHIGLLPGIKKKILSKIDDMVARS